MENIKKSTRASILELAPYHTVTDIVVKLGAQRKYVTTVLKNAGLQAKPEIVNLGGRPMKDKGITSKIKLTQSDMQKGNAKPNQRDKVFKQAVRDESAVRTVQLDGKTTVLLYPNDLRYSLPIDDLRADWIKKQGQQIRSLKGV